MFSLVVAILILGSAMIFRIAAILRLSIPLLYALIVPTLFHEWYYAHYALANGIWYAMLVLVAVSWVVSIVQKVRECF